MSVPVHSFLMVGIPDLQSMCIQYIKKHHDSRAWEFYKLPYSLRELVEDIGPQPIIRLKRKLPIFDSPKSPILGRLLRDWLRCVPQPYSALSCEIVLSVNAEVCNAHS